VYTNSKDWRLRLRVGRTKIHNKLLTARDEVRYSTNLAVFVINSPLIGSSFPLIQVAVLVEELVLCAQRTTKKKFWHAREYGISGTGHIIQQQARFNNMNNTPLVSIALIFLLITMPLHAHLGVRFSVL